MADTSKLMGVDAPGAQVFANNDLTVIDKAAMLCFTCGTKRGLEK